MKWKIIAAVVLVYLVSRKRSSGSGALVGWDEFTVSQGSKTATGEAQAPLDWATGEYLQPGGAPEGT